MLHYLLSYHGYNDSAKLVSIHPSVHRFTYQQILTNRKSQSLPPFHMVAGLFDFAKRRHEKRRATILSSILAEKLVRYGLSCFVSNLLLSQCVARSSCEEISRQLSQIIPWSEFICEHPFPIPSLSLSNSVGPS